MIPKERMMAQLQERGTVYFNVLLPINNILALLVNINSILSDQIEHILKLN